MDRRKLLLLLMISVTNPLTCFGGPLHLQDQLQNAGSDLSRYAIVFDAGSSKTKMEIYKINVNAPPLDATDIQQLDPSLSKVKPGIANLAGNPSAVANYLTPLLSSAKMAIPVQKQELTPVFFFATAGMRLLTVGRANSILDKVKRLLIDKNKCPFKFNVQNAKIISGQFEGIYAWITVNFLKGHFTPGNSHNTTGILDLGGASHQNTFDNPTNDTFTVTIGGQPYHLFARSYLGYGLNQARNRYLAFLSKQPTVNGVIESPCHHRGFQGQITTNGKTITVVGTALVEACRSIIDEMFFCKTPGCPFHKQPSLYGDFFGFAGIFYAAYGTGMLCFDCTKPLSPGMFEKSSLNFCAKQYQDVSSDPYAKRMCFQSNFVYELLTKGYALPANKMIQVGNKLEGFSLGWTLGAMLHNTGFL